MSEEPEKEEVENITAHEEIKKEESKEIKTENVKKNKEKFYQFENRISEERKKIRSIPKILYIMSKNIKLVVRSKTSSLIFFFGPLLIILLISLAFNTSSLYDLDVAVYSETYSSLTEDVLGNLSDNTYKVTKMENEQACKDAVKFDNFHVCAVFPPNMLLDNSGNNEIKLYVDSSRVNLAYTLSHQITSKVRVHSSKISEDMVTEILVTLDSINQELTKKKANLDKAVEENTNAKTQLTSVNSAITGLDFTYSSTNMSDILDEVSELEGEENKTFLALRKLLDNLDDSYTDIVTKMDVAQTKLETIKTNVGKAQSIASANENRLDTVKIAIDNAIAQVSGVKITNVENIVTPIRTTIEPITTNNSYLVYVLPTLLVLMMMFVGLLLGATTIMAERSSKAYFRNFITPTNDIWFIISQLVVSGIIMALQILLMLLVISFFVRGVHWLNYILIGDILLLIAVTFIGIGMALGYFFKTQQTVTIGAISTAVIFLFFSNTILPLEAIGRVYREIIYFNPFVLGEEIVRKLMLFDAPFIGYDTQLYALLGWLAVSLIAAYGFKKLSKRFKITDL